MKLVLGDVEPIVFCTLNSSQIYTIQIQMEESFIWGTKYIQLTFKLLVLLEDSEIC